MSNLIEVKELSKSYGGVQAVNTLEPVDFFSRETLRLILQDYSYYVDTQWFAANATVAMYIITVLLALGGVLGEKRKGALLMTVSLPVERWKWVATHAGVTAVLVFGLLLISSIGVVSGSLFIEKSYPACTAVLRACAIWLACFPLIGLSLLLNGFFRSGIKSALVLIPINLAGPQLIGFMEPAFYQWCPWRLADPRVWENGVYGRALLVSLLVGLGCTLLAALKFTREES